MTATKIRTGPVLFEAQRNGDVKTTFGGLPFATVSHLDTIRLAYWLVKTYVKAAAKRTDGGKA